MWWHVKHLLALHIEILENLLLIIWFERRKDFAVRAELERGGDFEFGELKWRGEIVTLVVVNSFLHTPPGRWSVDTEGNLRGVSKTRGDLRLKFSKFVAIFDDPVEARQRFNSVKESSTKQSQNSKTIFDEEMLWFSFKTEVQPGGDRYADLWPFASKSNTRLLFAVYVSNMKWEA